MKEIKGGDVAVNFTNYKGLIDSWNLLPSERSSLGVTAEILKVTPDLLQAALKDGRVLSSAAITSCYQDYAKTSPLVTHGIELYKECVGAIGRTQ